MDFALEIQNEIWLDIQRGPLWDLQMETQLARLLEIQNETWLEIQKGFPWDLQMEK